MTTKTCKICGENDETMFYKCRNDWKCKKCIISISSKKNEYGHKRNLSEKLKREFCDKCKLVINENNAHHFEWDHIEPKDKIHTISKLQQRQDNIFYEELKKCRLLCLFCHADVTKHQRYQGEIYGIRKNKYN